MCPRPSISTAPGSKDTNISEISSAISDVLTIRQKELVLSKLHRTVGSIVNADDPKVVTELIETLTRDHFTGWQNQLSTVAGEILLTRFSKYYDNFKLYCRILPKIFMLYDRHFQEQPTKQYLTTLPLIRGLFKKEVLADTQLIQATTSQLLIDILNARRRGDIDLTNVHNLVDMFYSYRTDPTHGLKLFDDFYKQLNDETERFYQGFFKSNFAGNSFPVYLQLAQEQFNHEEKIIGQILQPAEANNILICVYAFLLTQQTEIFLDQTNQTPPIAEALVYKDMRPIKWLVEMYKKFGNEADLWSLPPIYNRCAEFIKAEMLKHKENFKADLKNSDIVRLVGELISQTMTLINAYETVFGKIQKSKEALNKKITEAWNEPAFNIVDNFCIYLDDVIMSDFKSFPGEQREEFPKIFARFYTYLDDKLRFNGAYQQWYTRRFIKMRQRLHDIEEPLITYVQSAAKATEFANDFEDIYKRIKESAEIEIQFREKMASNNSLPGNITFSPLILEQRSFQLDRIIVNQLPKELAAFNNEFLKFYTDKFQTMKLMLLSDLSTFEAKLRIPRSEKIPQQRVYTISGDILCGSILLTIANAKDLKLTVREIIDAVNENQNRIMSYIARLCGKGAPILLRLEHKGTTLSPEDLIGFNPSYSNTRVKVMIQPITRTSKADSKRNTENAQSNKLMSLKAAIVRVLKQRNIIDQRKLEEEVTVAVEPYFRAELQMIRTALSNLENDDYFDRSGNQNNPTLTYHQ